MPNPMANGQQVFSGDPVSTPPFVDDVDGDGNTEVVTDADIVEPDSEDGAAALQQDFSGSLGDKIDLLTHKIEDLLTLNKVDRLIDTLTEAFQDAPEPESPGMPHGGGSMGGEPTLSEPDMSDVLDDADDGGPEVPDESGPDAEEDEQETDTDREAAVMAKNMRRATDEDGKVTDALSADEVLKDVTDQGIDFQPAQDKNATEPQSTSAEVGDNYEGSQKTYDDAEDESLKPVSATAALRLADAYVTAGVASEADRYTLADGFAKMPRIAAEHELKALSLVRKANAKRTEAMKRAALRRAALNRKARRAAQFRKAGDTQVYDLEGQQTGTITPAEDGTYSFDVDGQTGDGYATESEALDAAKEQTGNDDLVTSTAVAAARRRSAARKAAVNRRKAKAAPRKKATAATAKRTAGRGKSCDDADRRKERREEARKAARRAALRRAARRRAAERKAGAATKSAPKRLSAANRARIAARVAAARKANGDPKATARRAALNAARTKAARRTPNITRTAASKADGPLALL
ncbi:hypothetical protein [uncultured Bifidobacterium sp.]|uniref:hypothetical protein n=1 Tax=uncultured Bifidobacterium sp. TaxID=165187 RepID=UPI002595103E|nr:hypothetical protein [uncultured Bifidobacterium sp.]